MGLNPDMRSGGMGGGGLPKVPQYEQRVPLKVIHSNQNGVTQELQPVSSPGEEVVGEPKKIVWARDIIPGLEDAPRGAPPETNL